MQWISTLLICVLVFGLCWLVDKGFTKLFRGKPQHRSGLSVRLNKHYGGMGLAMAVIGLAAIFTGLKQGTTLLIVGGGLLIGIGIGLVVYFMTFGVYYDTESFLVTSFLKKDKVYPYRDIQAQKLYINGGTILIELYLTDGSTVHLQSNMNGTYAFLDHAFEAWLVQTGRSKEECAFHDPQNSCWFPNAED